jgi:hypothetical protein
VFATISGVMGNGDKLLTLVKGDLTGPKNYIYWAISIMILGALGYVEDLKPLSRSMLVLVLIVLVLSDDTGQGQGGFFAEFEKALSQISGSNTSNSKVPQASGSVSLSK